MTILKTLKNLFLIIGIGLISSTTWAQNTSSPYSMFGVGDLASPGFGRSLAMGGVLSPLLSARTLNPSNPASYMALLPRTFLFEVGFSGNKHILETESDSYSSFNGNIKYIAAGFPITNWWKSGIGMKPLSSIGYEIQQEYNIENDTVLMRNHYKGEGGINSLYFDNSFKILKSLSLGVKVAYLFGSLDKETAVRSFNSSSTTQLVESNRSVFDGLAVGFGAHFHTKINDKLFFNLGATYNLGPNLDANQERLITLSTSKTGGGFFLDTVENALLNQGQIELPQTYSIGTSVLINQKLEIAADYQVEKWSKNSFFGNTSTFEDNEKFCAGIEYTPDYASTKYLKLISYRAGFNVTNSYLIIQDKQLKQTGASLGLGFPLRSGALINIAAMYNTRTIPGENILKENHFEFHLNLSLRASWFHKREFN